MDEEFNKRLSDYFDAHELTYVLEIPAEDIVDAFQELIAEKRQDLEEMMVHGK